MNAKPAPLLQTWTDVLVLSVIVVYFQCLAAFAFYMLRWLLTR